MTCVTNFWILIISIHTSRFGNRINQIWQPLLFINARKIPRPAPPTGRPGRTQSGRTPEFGYGPLNKILWIYFFYRISRIKCASILKHPGENAWLHINLLDKIQFYFKIKVFPWTVFWTSQSTHWFTYNIYFHFRFESKKCFKLWIRSSLRLPFLRKYPLLGVGKKRSEWK